MISASKAYNYSIIFIAIFVMAVLTLALAALSIRDTDTVRLEERITKINIDLSKAECKLTEIEFRLLRLWESNKRIKTSLAEIKNLLKSRGYTWFPRGLRDDTTDND